MVTIEDFLKLDIRIGTIISAKQLSNSEKLIKLILDFGTEQKQILTGIGPFFPDLKYFIGKQIPALLNVEPRKMAGELSEGMIIAIDGENKPVLLLPDEKVPNGSIVK